MSLLESIEAIRAFQGDSLTASLAAMEQAVQGVTSETAEGFCSGRGINDECLNSALEIKRMAGQINVIVHAAGIIRSLPAILRNGEVVESVSLGAGNAGRKFDLETNHQVAEFKFIDWQGGAETIRQNGIFKDYYELAEYPTDKRKVLYVVGTKYPLKFFKGKRAITSVLSKQPAILNAIREKYGNSVLVVRDYHEIMKASVEICDVSPYIGRGT